MYKNGHELISAMQKEKNLTYWTDKDLLSFISDNGVAYIRYNYHEPTNRCCFTLDGYFDRAELEALVILAENEEGTPRG